MELDDLIIETKKALSQIQHPVYHKSLLELKSYGSIEQEGDIIRLLLRVPDADRKIQIQLEAKVRGVLQKLNPQKKLKIRFEVDETHKPEDDGRRIKGINKIIAIGSGKGGVGKSTVAANLAATIARSGRAVGLLDGDIYGPSMGKMFGRQGKIPLVGDGESKIYPEEIMGIKLLSFSFLLDSGQAVIWRGPMLGKAMQQFLFEVIWGELDFLIIDLPPGTGDVQLSLSQLIDLDGALIVTTPQDVAIQDAQRAFAMFQQVNVQVLGIIENMAGFICPHCGKESHIFSENGADTFASRYGVTVLGKIPLDPALMKSGEEGKPLLFDIEEGAVKNSYFQILKNLDNILEKKGA